MPEVRSDIAGLAERLSAPSTHKDRVALLSDFHTMSGEPELRELALHLIHAVASPDSNTRLGALSALATISKEPHPPALDPLFSPVFSCEANPHN